MVLPVYFVLYSKIQKNNIAEITIYTIPTRKSVINA